MRFVALLLALAFVLPGLLGGFRRGLAAAGCARGGRALPLERRIDDALERGIAALIERQSADGAWRSTTYGALRDPLALTPAVLKACLYAPTEAGHAAGRRGLDVLVSRVRPDGTIETGEHGLGYPVYTAALATIALTQAGGARELAARDAWLALLERYQLDERLGWTPDDPAYGGWGYSPRPPRRRPGTDGGSGLDADLSSTLFAVGALRIAGATADDPRIQRALRFVVRCQNLPLDGSAGLTDLDTELDTELDDGGFFFTPTNELQNKAGTLGVDATGRRRFRSYGSMTADGLRALLRCGLEADHPRVAAARAWLEAHFDPDRNPGDYDAVREVERRSSYYYAAWSEAHALFQVGSIDLDWARPLAEAILARQRDDGTWSNPAGAVMEDDPLVATPFALAVLSLCRAARLTEGERPVAGDAGGCPVSGLVRTTVGARSRGLALLRLAVPALR